MSDLCRSDAAYLLGALSATERREFEAHLADCADCQRSISQHAGIPGLLAAASETDLDEQPPVPETLLPALVAAVRRRGRWRTRVALGAGAAVAAAAVVAGLVIAFSHDDPAEYTEAMQQVGSSPVHATVSLVDKPWGTEVDLKCRYEIKGKLPANLPKYKLFVIDHSGAEQLVATWAVTPKVATITGSVDWKAEDIASVRVATASGRTLLSVDP